ncbi:hypothetical protein A5866_002038 [Enterococcus sp. 12C11_DIV0727]|uniref:Uncharacterized protein n=1 Tax=Candidatus Enterococcus lemimoniae TaxID=1834167 RepID=A0ABZ2TA00_9ENTE
MPSKKDIIVRTPILPLKILHFMECEPFNQIEKYVYNKFEKDIKLPFLFCNLNTDSHIIKKKNCFLELLTG